MKRLFATLAFATALTLLPVASYGWTPISSVPYTISVGGTYILTNSLNYSGAVGNAITVNASNVIIDLDGYQLFCSVIPCRAKMLGSTGRAELCCGRNSRCSALCKRQARSPSTQRLAGAASLAVQA